MGESSNHVGYTHLSTSLVILAILTSCSQGIQWLSLSKISAVSFVPPTPDPAPAHCDHLKKFLVNQQVRFCRDHPSFMPAVTDGANYAIDECQFQFRTRRWNCSTLNDPLKQQQRRRYRKEKLKKKDVIQGIQLPYETPSTSNSTVPKLGTLKSKNLKLEQSLEKNPSSNSKLSKNDVIHPPEALYADQAVNVTTTTSKANPYKAEPYKDRKRTKRRGKKRKRSKPRKHRYLKDRRKRRGTIRPRPVVPEGTREAAFVHAISSAGVAHAITRKCTSGLLSECGCDLSVRGVTSEGFQWQGCSDNVAYGISLSKRFVDARDLQRVRRSKRKPGRKKRSVAKALMNLHNNEAGRRLIESNMKVNCKCHGVSGSCEVKTCWKSMPTFREIGEYLKEKFDGATEMKIETVAGRYELQPNQQFFRPPSETDLVFLAKSPEYCERDLFHGILGTKGRRCNKGSNSLDGCDLLCCGRGYTTTWENGTERCNCKFHWCCFVQCSMCYKNEQVHVCN